MYLECFACWYGSCHAVFLEPSEPDILQSFINKFQCVNTPTAAKKPELSNVLWGFATFYTGWQKLLTM